MKTHLITFIKSPYGPWPRAICSTSRSFAPHLGIKWEERQRVDCAKCQKHIARIEAKSVAQRAVNQ